MPTETHPRACRQVSRVFVGFVNNATGNMTSDLVADPAAYSRNDTLFGPSAPPAADSQAYSGAELYLNKDAAAGLSGVKVATVKPGKRIKIVATNLGDGDAASGDQDANDLDLSVLTPSDIIMAVLTIHNANDSSTHRMCAQFESPTIKSIAGGTGFKYLSKTSTLPTSCPE